MTELHEATFKWPAGPSKVIVKGSFDNWATLTELTNGQDGFTGTFHLPWDTKVTYKYIVDGQWRTDPSKPQEPDEAGNINNVYTSPPKPVAAVMESSPPVPVPVSNVPAAEKTSMEGAKDTAASVVSYMASGLGAAFASVTGIDPINPRQIPLEDDKAKEVLETIPDAKKEREQRDLNGESPMTRAKNDVLKMWEDVPLDPRIGPALVPIADEPVVLPTTSTITNSASQAATALTEQATSATTTIGERLPTSAAEAYLQGIAADKVPEPTADTTVPVPEPYEEGPTTDAIPIPGAPEPYNGTNGTHPAKVESTPTNVAEAVEKVKEGVASSTSEATSTTVKGTPPASPTKKAFPGSVGRAGSISSSTADGTLKRKNRKSIFGKLKEVLTPDKRKKEKAGSTSS